MNDWPPPCDLCTLRGAEHPQPAKYDGPIEGRGTHAYACESHRDLLGPDPLVNELGGMSSLTGTPSQDAEPTGAVPVVDVPMALDSIVTVDCPHCGASRTVEPDADYEVTCESCTNRYQLRPQL